MDNIVAQVDGHLNGSSPPLTMYVKSCLKRAQKCLIIFRDGWFMKFY